MRLAVGRRMLWALGLCVLCSCGEEGPARKATYPVTGTVMVDGAPAANLAIQVHNVNGMDKEQPTVSSAFTKEDGTFALATYDSGDGVPEGEYALTFMWGQMNLVSMNYGGPDRLKDRYRDPKKSEVRFEVNGEPVDLGSIELRTK